MPTMDIFNQDAFNCVSVTQALEKVPFQPSLLGQLGIFEPVPVRTDVVAVEKRDGVLSIIQTSKRGAPLEDRAVDKRSVRNFNTSRIAKGSTLYAATVQNMRAMGSETELESVQAEVMRRYAGPTGLLRDIELTWENMRLGAIQGIVLDADGSTIYNWFTEWGLSAPSAINFALGTAATNVRGKCSQVERLMRKASKGAWIPGRTQVHALAGDTFYDDLIDHPTVRDTYLGWAAAADLRQGGAYSAFSFGGITWHNYRGTDDFSDSATSGTAAIGIKSTEAKFFPVNAPGVFQVAHSPLESFEYVNTPGMPVYGMVVQDKERGFWARPEAYSYPLFMCTRPEMLQKAVRA
jgi:hypothetical protein